MAKRPAFRTRRQARFMFARNPAIAKKMVKRARHAGAGFIPGKKFKKKGK